MAVAAQGAAAVARAAVSEAADVAMAAVALGTVRQVAATTAIAATRQSPKSKSQPALQRPKRRTLLHDPLAGLQRMMSVNQTPAVSLK